MSEFMDWHKRATAVSNALYAEGDRRRLGAYSGFMYGVGSALTWAAEQEPTDAEVDAAARALCDITYGLDWPRLVDGWKNKPYPDFPHLVDDLRDQARSALLAAQKVRVGL